VKGSLEKGIKHSKMWGEPAAGEVVFRTVRLEKQEKEENKRTKEGGPENVVWITTGTGPGSLQKRGREWGENLAPRKNREARYLSRKDPEWYCL